MGLESEIIAAITANLSPESLQVVNESHKHAGHSGDDGSGESHWRVVIRAPALDNMTRLARHRAVHSAIGPAIISRIHALAIDIQ